MINWFCSRVLFLSVSRRFGHVYLYVHFLPRYCYRVWWDQRRGGFGGDRYLKAGLSIHHRNGV